MRITPPTDNLYKFTSISGLVLLLVSATFPFSKATNLAVKQAELAGQYEKLKIEAAELNKELRTAVSDCRSGGNVSKEEYQHLANKKHDQDINKVEVEKNENVVKVLVQEIRFYTYVGIIGAAVGLVLAIIGFCLWYTRVQKFEDKILQKRAQAFVEESYNQEDTPA